MTRFTEKIDKNKTVVIYCQKGEMSVPAAEALLEAGVDARSLNGGYLAWLMESMKQKEEAQKEEETPEYVEIEQSIRKKFRKTIWCRFTRAVREYELVKEGDKIAVCISGGKDSMLMAKLFQELKRHNKFNFEVVFLVMDPGYSPANRQIIEANAKRMNIPSGSADIKVCSYEKIKLTNREIPDLSGWTCTCGIDFSKITDLVSVNLHFRDENIRYDINHSWLCSQSKDIPRIKAPLEEWRRRGLLTMVDDVEIHPEIITDYIQAAMMKYCIKGIAIDDFRYALLAAALREIGFDAKVYKNLKLVRPSDIMRVATVIDSCFANDNFIWGDNPVLRWGTNNTKMIPYGRKPGKKDDADIGNYVYGKIEAKSRKTDPFMALVASMTIEDMIPYAQTAAVPDIGVMTY